MRPFWKLLKIDPATPEGRRLIAFLTLSFCGGMLSGPVSSLLAVYVDAQLRQPPTFTAALLAFQLATTGIFALISGVVADGLGQKRTLLLGFLGVPIAALVFLLHSFWVLVIVLVGLGITNALSSIGGQSYLVAVSPPMKLGGFTALYYLGNTLGGAIGNAAAGPAAQRWGFSTVGLAGLVLSAVLLLSTVFLLPEVQPRRGIHRPGVRALLASYGSLARQRNIALVAIVRFLPTCYYGATSLLMPLLIYRLGQSVAVASFYATTSLVLAMACQQVIGRLIDRAGPLGPARILAALVPVVAAGTALAVRSLPLLFICGVLSTGILWCISTTIPALVREAATEDSQGRALGLIHLVWSSGMLIGTLSAGALVGIDAHLPFAVGAAINLLTLPAALALTRSLKRASYVGAAAAD